ncbi:MAG: type II toxin-antitoxin system VapC family toxin [Sphingorhabdus sp.]
MIVVDTSALVAILLQEIGHTEYLSEIAAAQRVIMGAPTKFEFLMVSKGKLSEVGISAAKALIAVQQIEVVNWDEGLADLAAQAFLEYGRGQHKAALNFGDCMAYALAKSLDAPLLFKGNAFSKTDIRPAL